jgi:hypothetical protein
VGVVIARRKDREIGAAHLLCHLVADVAHPPLMGGVVVRLKQADHDAIDAERDQFTSRLAGLVLS